MATDEPTPEQIADLVAACPAAEGYPARWHRGERVEHISGQRGVVLGWKGERVLVLWGTMNGQDFRSWEESSDVRLISEAVVDL